MNREQRRHPTNNTDKHVLEKIQLMERILKEAPNDIQEGQRVKLDYDKIKSHPDYNRLQEPYKLYIEGNKDLILTVKFDDRYANHTIVALIDECGEKSIWRFVISDLIMIEDDDYE